MSTEPNRTWRELVWSVAKYFKNPTPKQVYDRLAAKYPWLKEVLTSPSARSCVRSAMADLRATGYLRSDTQRAKMARHPKPWNLRNKRRREQGMCVSCPLPAVKVNGESVGRCAAHRAQHSEACAKLKRRRGMH
ncbi:MAG: hypothetical protein E6Q97_21240 [Desulfurellales bacterium]|nr:MAG: hypothetical protein E6Q97_21240 [Desulfurellales bacterium]